MTLIEGEAVPTGLAAVGLRKSKGLAGLPPPVEREEDSVGAGFIEPMVVAGWPGSFGSLAGLKEKAGGGVGVTAFWADAAGCCEEANPRFVPAFGSAPGVVNVGGCRLTLEEEANILLVA